LIKVAGTLYNNLKSCDGCKLEQISLQEIATRRKNQMAPFTKWKDGSMAPFVKSELMVSS
jgi:hypothetical protein